MQFPHPVAALSTLDPDDVHIWRAWLDDADAVPRFDALLSDDERKRANRFVYGRHRAAFVSARGLLRTILGRYLDSDPAALRFAYQPHGKPCLATCTSGLRFNLAHSHGLAVYAVTRDCDVGVDVEFIRSEVAGDAIAERHFSAVELGELRNLPAEQRTRGFFNAWTRKEAYVKALGLGLSLPLDDFDVALTPDAPAALLGVRGAALRQGTWSLHDLSMPAGYVGALAIEGASCRLCCGDWPGGE